MSSDGRGAMDGRKGRGGSAGSWTACWNVEPEEVEGDEDRCGEVVAMARVSGCPTEATGRSFVAGRSRPQRRHFDAIATGVLQLV